MSFATIWIANGSDLWKRRIRADSTSAPRRYTTTRALRQQSGSAGCRFSAGGGGSTGREQIEKSDKAIIAVEAISEQCPQPTPRGALPIVRQLPAPTLAAQQPIRGFRRERD